MRMTTETIPLALYPDEHCRSYHTKESLTEKTIEMYDGDLSDCGAVCETIGQMRGVTKCFVSRYSILVHKGEAFSWEEIEPEILNFIGSLNQLPEVPA